MSSSSSRGTEAGSVIGVRGTFCASLLAVACAFVQPTLAQIPNPSVGGTNTSASTGGGGMGTNGTPATSGAYSNICAVASPPCPPSGGLITPLSNAGLLALSAPTSASQFAASRTYYSTPGDSPPLIVSWCTGTGGVLPCSAGVLAATPDNTGFIFDPGQASGVSGGNCNSGCWVAVYGSDGVDATEWGINSTIANISSILRTIDAAMASAAWLKNVPRWLHLPPTTYTDDTLSAATLAGGIERISCSGPDICTVNLASGATTSNNILTYTGLWPLEFDYLKFVCPSYFQLGAFVEPAGGYGFIAEQVTPTQGTSIKMRHVSAEGCNNQISIYSFHDVDLQLDDMDDAYNYAVDVSDNLSYDPAEVTHVNITGRARNCGYWCFNSSASTNPAPATVLSPSDIHFDVSCNAAGFLSHRGCADMSSKTEDMLFARVRVMDSYWGLESKFTQPLFPNALPGTLGQSHFDLAQFGGTDFGPCLTPGFENSTATAAPDLENTIDGTVSCGYQPPRVWLASVPESKATLFSLGNATYRIGVAGVSAASAPNLTSMTCTCSISGTTLTINTLLTGAPAVGEVLVAAPGLLYSPTKILSGSGTSWVVDQSASVSSIPISGINQNYGYADGTAIVDFLQATPPWAISKTALNFNAMANFDFTVHNYGTAYGVRMFPEGSSDNTIRRGIIHVDGWTTTACVNDGPPTSVPTNATGIVDRVTLDGHCHVGGFNDWTASVVHNGDLLLPLNATDNAGHYIYEATTGGVSGSSEPDPFNQTIGATTTDGSVTWTNVGKYLPEAPIMVGFGYGDWAASTPFSGSICPTSATYNPGGYYYLATTPGTSGGSEPSFNQTIGGTTVDNTIVWTNEGLCPSTEWTNLLVGGDWEGAVPGVLGAFSTGLGSVSGTFLPSVRLKGYTSAMYLAGPGTLTLMGGGDYETGGGSSSGPVFRGSGTTATTTVNGVGVLNVVNSNSANHGLWDNVSGGGVTWNVIGDNGIVSLFPTGPCAVGDIWRTLGGIHLYACPTSGTGTEITVY
jgi:hypothetical protein